MNGMLLALWQYRAFVASSIRNEFLNRFARSRLGGLWIILNPLMQVLIFALVLSNVLAAKLPGIDNPNAYPLYLMAGSLAWGLFSEIVGRCLNLFIEQGRLMKQIRFPRVTLPAIAVGSSLLNNLLLFISILFIFTLMGHTPTVFALLILPLTLVTTIMATSLGLFLGILNVFFRDLAQVVPVLLQIVFWLTPIVYPLSAIPEAYKPLLEYNPIYPLISAYHDALVFGEFPEWSSLTAITLISVLVLLFALFIFRRASADMVDVL